MKSGTCKNCSSTEVYKIAVGGAKRGPRNALTLGVFAQVPVISYVCVDCGYLEEYIEGNEYLEKVKKAGEKI